MSMSHHARHLLPNLFVNNLLVKFLEISFFFLSTYGHAIFLPFRLINICISYSNFNCFFGLQAKDITSANACKITPAKFSGSKEIVPLHFRRHVSSYILGQLFNLFGNLHLCHLITHATILNEV